MQRQAGATTQRIPPERAGQRLDNFLLGQLKGVPRAHVYRLLRTGQVRVNGARVKARYRLAAGDQVRLPPVRQDPALRAAPAADVLERLRASVLFEDEELLVLDKPGGLAVHAGSGVRTGIVETLRDGVAEYRALELVHRLDKDTSGCLLLAKRRAALLRLHRALREGALQKEYLTLVAGHWRRTRMVELPLVRRDGTGPRKIAPAAGGKASRSEFRPLRRLSGSTLMRVSLLTGRTHQIRVHAAHSGHPIAGDRRYGDFAYNRRLRELGLRRMFLHAATVRLPHHGVLEVRAPLPAALEDLLRELEPRRRA